MSLDGSVRTDIGDLAEIAPTYIDGEVEDAVVEQAGESEVTE